MQQKIQIIIGFGIPIRSGEKSDRKSDSPKNCEEKPNA